MNPTILEVLQIPQNDATGGVIVYDREQQRCKEYFSESIGWQLIETRGVVIIQMERYTGGCDSRRYVRFLPSILRILSYRVHM